ncbi:phage tail protein [Lactobacillus rhamnosus]|uniref:Phage tail protein n=1 Tax=Lacticaseibacillus rhamnosus TaxID=47715 RepID=A0A7Y7QHA0_LACRH|nr:phage tail protein [Lacticaseibacillus rhamnosus]NVO88951.1 phage tail protein [Lacticaseibacillus rhamnosus]
MELRGLNDFVLALLDPSTGQIIADKDKGLSADGTFKVDLGSSKGATQANITGLAPTATKVYGSNQVAEQEVGSASPSVALAANDIPHLIYDKAVGMEADSVNGGYADKDGILCTGGVILHSQSPEGVDAYLAFPMGIITPGELNLRTNTQNPVSVHDAMTLAVQARPSDALVYQKFYSDDDNFDYQKMLAFIFPGYKAPAPKQ